MTFTQAQIDATIAHRDALRAEFRELTQVKQLHKDAVRFERMKELGNLVTHFDFVVDKVLGGTNWKRYEKNTGLTLQAVEA